MANVCQTCTHPPRSLFHLCMVCGIFPLFRQFLHFSRTLCVGRKHRLVWRTQSARTNASEPWAKWGWSRRYALRLSTCIDLPGWSWPDHVLHQYCHQPLQDFWEGQVICWFSPYNAVLVHYVTRALDIHQIAIIFVFHYIYAITSYISSL